jgi:hypothetical protein
MTTQARRLRLPTDDLTVSGGSTELELVELRAVLLVSVARDRW